VHLSSTSFSLLLPLLCLLQRQFHCPAVAPAVPAVAFAFGG
jgi:hypothetical protein